MLRFFSIDKECKKLIINNVHNSRRYIKENRVDIAHLNELISVFLDCDS